MALISWICSCRTYVRGDIPCSKCHRNRKGELVATYIPVSYGGMVGDTRWIRSAITRVAGAYGLPKVIKW